MNYLNRKLKSLQTSKAILKQELDNTIDEHIRQKLEHQIDCLSKEEDETLNQLNLRLNDIILIDEEKEE